MSWGIPATFETQLPSLNDFPASLQRPSPAWNAFELLARNRRLLKVEWSGHMVTPRVLKRLLIDSKFALIGI